MAAIAESGGQALLEKYGRAHYAALGRRHAKLTEEQVIAIRRRYAEGESLRSLSDCYGVGTTTISQAARRLTWAHI